MSCRSLIQVSCARFYNWIFVNEDPQAQPLEQHFAPFVEYFKQFQPETFRFIKHEAFDVPCNVKVLLDAFLEAYHLKSIHQNTVDRFLDHRGTTIALYRNGHSIMVTPNRRPDWVDPGTKGMRRIETATRGGGEEQRLVQFLPEPGGAGGPDRRAVPDVLARHRAPPCASRWTGSRPTGAAGRCPSAGPCASQNFDRILDEDLQFAAAIQESVMSPGFRGMPLNYQERRIYHWHQELDRRIGRGTHRSAVARRAASSSRSSRTDGSIPWPISVASLPSAPMCRDLRLSRATIGAAMGWLHAAEQGARIGQPHHLQLG